VRVPSTGQLRKRRRNPMNNDTRLRWAKILAIISGIPLVLGILMCGNLRASFLLLVFTFMSYISDNLKRKAGKNIREKMWNTIESLHAMNTRIQARDFDPSNN